eukprot:CAMPEP_0169296940 /NCGR_PEP_ID=MMETSP1016-20121227/65430_1 /TAXON_ID=342587 /ORGANISM="Karlodinium micrum, Strain CCMP2283" /LENGTH=326 /DNA_ID=CAMNT_0009388409 /DNA_START=21 /DNA_END=997 /DNA_ORIENTATION=-
MATAAVLAKFSDDDEAAELPLPHRSDAATELSCFFSSDAFNASASTLASKIGSFSRSKRHGSNLAAHERPRFYSCSDRSISTSERVVANTKYNADDISESLSRSGSLVKTAVSPSGATTLTPASFQASFSPRATLVASPPRRLESNTPVSRTQSSPNMLAHQSSMPAVVLTAQDASLQASQVHRCEHVDVPNGVPIIAAAMPATALGPSSFDSSCEDICIRSPGNSPSKAVLSTASPGSTDLQFFSPDTSPSKTTPAILNTSPRSNAASQLDIADVTFQSGGSVSSTTRSQGIATCALCHALLHYSVGQHNFQVLLASSTLPGVSP